METFVYGTPRGFDFHEGVASMNDYFMGLYVSTRQGKRLTVNRRDDGTTIYSYLRYGLIDCGGRRNAFFGCSVMLDRGQYCPDFKVLFDWFDYLFGRIVERGKVFRVNDGGQLQYMINKFKDAEEEIEWLKANMPNIFKSKDVSLMAYDTSFTQQNTGKVICCNIDTPTVQLVDDFRRYNWLSVSPEFAPEPVIEINFTDLESKLNDYNRRMVGMAVNPTPDALTELNALESTCHRIMADLDLYSRKVQDETELTNCRESTKKYGALLANVRTLISRIETLPGPKPPMPEPAPPEPPVRTRICRKCHTKKPVTEFTLKPDVCDVCVRAQPKPIPWWERVNPMYMAFAAVAVIGIISLLLIAKDCGGGIAEGADSIAETDTAIETEPSVAETEVPDQSRLSDMFGQTGQQLIPVTPEIGDSKQHESANPVATTKPEKKTFTITITNKDNQDKNELGTFQFEGSIDGSNVMIDAHKQNYVFNAGTYVCITTKPAQIVGSNRAGSPFKGGFKVRLEKGKNVQFKINGQKIITITPKDNGSFQTDGI